MSLRTDQFFFNAIRANTSLWNQVGGRVFNPDRSTVDEKADRIPYLIIHMDGVRNDIGSKDDVEGDTDTVQIGILCVASDRDKLATLTEAVRRQCITYLHQVEEDPTASDRPLAPTDWEFTAEAVNYDEKKPCVWQQLNYKCDTNR